MKYIRLLYQRMKEQPTRPEILFPSFYLDTKEHKDKKRIIFVNPRINRFNLYNMISPCIFLNYHSKRLACMMSGLVLDKKELDTNYEIEDHIKLNRWEIERAHLIVFPFVTDDLLPYFSKIRAWNPKIKIAYCIDFNYYDVPPGHFQYPSINLNIPIIEKNIRGLDHMPGTDFIMVGSEELRNYIQEKLGGFEVGLMLMPQLMHELYTDDIDITLGPQGLKRKKVKIGVFVDQFRKPDVEANRNLYLWLQKEHAADVDLFYFGIDPYYGTDPQNSRYKPLISEREKGEKKKAAKKAAKSQISNLKSQIPNSEAIDDEPDYKDNFSRAAREPYQYFFKNFYNLNCDLYLFLYDQKSNFWKYSSMDVDMLTAIFFEIPVLTNVDFNGVNVARTEKEQMEWLNQFIAVQKETYPDETNDYVQGAINLRHSIEVGLTWNAQSQAYIEDFFLNPITEKKQEQNDDTTI